MKLKTKLILDMILFCIIWVVMTYNLTGNLLHELLGIGLIAGFLVHIFMHRSYYFKMPRLLFSSNSTVKNSFSYMINVFLLIATITMLISSVAISKDLFTFINSCFENFNLWKTIHIISAVVILICMTIHIILHTSMFITLINHRIKHLTATSQSFTKVISSILAIAMVVIVLKISYNQMSSLAIISTRKNDSDSTPYITESNITTSQEDVTITDSQTTAAELTLTEYLGKLFCNGCGKHCSLLSPKCGKGRNQAEKAKIEYNEIYNSEED